MPTKFERLGYSFKDDNDKPETKLEFSKMNLSDSYITQIENLKVVIEEMLADSDATFLDAEFKSIIIGYDEHDNEIVELTTRRQYLETIKTNLESVITHNCFDYPGIKNTNRGEKLIFDLLEAPIAALDRLQIARNT